MCENGDVNALVMLSCLSFGIAIYLTLSSPLTWRRAMNRGRGG
jgi:hypothetical protein